MSGNKGNQTKRSGANSTHNDKKAPIAAQAPPMQVGSSPDMGQQQPPSEGDQGHADNPQKAGEHQTSASVETRNEASQVGQLKGGQYGDDRRPDDATHSGNIQLLNVLGALVVALLVTSYPKFVTFLQAQLHEHPQNIVRIFAHVASFAYLFSVFRQIYGLAIVETDKRYLKTVMPRFTRFDSRMSIASLLLVLAIPVFLVFYVDDWLESYKQLKFTADKAHAAIASAEASEAASKAKEAAKAAGNAVREYVEGSSTTAMLVSIALLIGNPLIYLLWDLNALDSIEKDLGYRMKRSRPQAVSDQVKLFWEVRGAKPESANCYKGFCRNWLILNVRILVGVGVFLVALAAYYFSLHDPSGNASLRSLLWFLIVAAVVISALYYSLRDLALNHEFYFPAVPEDANHSIGQRKPSGVKHGAQQNVNLIGFLRASAKRLVGGCQLISPGIGCAPVFVSGGGVIGRKTKRH